MERLDWELKYKEAQNCSGNGIWIKLGSDTYFKQHSSQLEPTFHWRLLLDPLSMDGFLPSIWPAFLILRKKAWGLCKSLWWSSRSKVERMHEREHLFGNPMSGDLSDVLNFMFANYRQESWEREADSCDCSHHIVPAICYYREVLIKEGSQRKLPRCDSGDSGGQPTLCHCRLVSSWSNNHFWFAAIHSNQWRYMPQRHRESIDRIPFPSIKLTWLLRGVKKGSGEKYSVLYSIKEYVIK